MENTHYTPEESEYHLGFEYEIQEEIGTSKISHKREVFKNSFHPDRWDCVFQTENKVKFLDRDDIESLGWSLDQKVDGDYFFMIGNMLDGDYMLTTDDFKNIFITPMIGSSKGGIFEGSIKNKSELNKLMQMLNIKTT